MERADRHIGEGSSRSKQPLAIDKERALPFEDVERFHFAAIDVRRRPSAWRNGDLKRRILAAGFSSGSEKTIDIARQVLPYVPAFAARTTTCDSTVDTVAKAEG